MVDCALRVMLVLMLEMLKFFFVFFGQFVNVFGVIVISNVLPLFFILMLSVILASKHMYLLLVVLLHMQYKLLKSLQLFLLLINQFLFFASMILCRMIIFGISIVFCLFSIILYIFDLFLVLKPLLYHLLIFLSQVCNVLLFESGLLLFLFGNLLF